MIEQFRVKLSDQEKSGSSLSITKTVLLAHPFNQSDVNVSKSKSKAFVAVNTIVAYPTPKLAV
jgi:hypothetical protein